MTGAERFKQAAEKLLLAYKKLNSDLEAGLEPAVLKEIHEESSEKLIEEVEELLELPEPEIIIEVKEGEIVEVHSNMQDTTYIIHDDRYVFDPYAVKTAVRYPRYAIAIAEIEQTEEIEVDA